MIYNKSPYPLSKGIKRVENQRHYFLPFALIVLMVTACQKDIDNETANATSEAIPQGVIDLSFEIETVTIPNLKNPENATSQERIQAMMYSERNEVKMSAYDDGTTMWRMEKLKPKHDLSVRHETPPSDHPEVKVTLIDRSGMGSFYDAKNLLLFKHKVPIPDYSEVVAKVKKNPNMLFLAMGVSTANDLTSLLSAARERGDIVSDLGNGMVSVRSGQGSSSARLQSEADFVKVDIFNTGLGILMGSTMYDQQEKVVCQAFYSYQLVGSDRLVPQAIFMQSWDTDPVTGDERKTETNTYFDNVTATINVD